MIEDSCFAKLAFSIQADTCGVNLGGTLTNFHNFPFRQTPAKFTYHRFWTFAFVPCWYTMRYIYVKNGYFSSHFLEEFYTERTCFGGSFTWIQLLRTNYFYIELVTVLLGIINGITNTFHLNTEYIRAVRYLLKLYRDTRVRSWQVIILVAQVLQTPSSFDVRTLVTAVILFSLTASVAANDSFKDLSSLHRASTCCLSDWFCCLREVMVSLDVLVNSIGVK